MASPRRHNSGISRSSLCSSTSSVLLLLLLFNSITTLPELVSGFVGNDHHPNYISIHPSQRLLLLLPLERIIIRRNSHYRRKESDRYYAFISNSQLSSSIHKDDSDGNEDEHQDIPTTHLSSSSSSSVPSDTISSPEIPPTPSLKIPAKAPYRPLGPKLTKTMRQLDDTIFRNIVQYLAELSLQDYQWRTSLFQQNEADRMMEESMARIRFGEDDIQTNMNYIRPMDAPTLGPLGKLEKYYVTLLYDVFHEEQRRAQRIIASSGKLIRPSKNTISSMEAPEEDEEEVEVNEAAHSVRLETTATLGPLGRFEAQVVAFWTSIRQEELLRIRTKTWRPKDLQQRGPLGQLEYYISTFLEEIRSSELIRAQQAKIRNDGTIVRPIDVPGPLGEMELRVSDIIQEEFRRVQEKRQIRTTGGSGTTATSSNNSNNNSGSNSDDNTFIPFSVLRPKDATNPGPLGAAEATAYAAIQSVSQEEMERLKAIQRTMMEYRPINHPPTSTASDPNTSHQKNNSELSSSSSTSQQQTSSPLSIVLYTLETIVVGMVRAPQLVFRVVTRVQELLSSTPLDTNDVQLLQQQQLPTTSTNPLPSSLTFPMNDNDDDNNNNNNNNNNDNSKNQKQNPPPPLGEFL